MSIRKSLFFSFIDRYAGLIITIIASMIIARLMTPTEIGVFSVAMVLLMLANTVRDFGAGQYLVQEKNLTIERIRAVWTVQLSLGIGLACVVLIASDLVAIFYNEPRMRDIMLVMALNYAVNPFGSLTYAWLMREMCFKSIAIMRFSSGLCGALVSIWLAWKNFGPVSLAFGSLASTVVNACLAFFYRPKFFPWLPGIKEIKCVLTFGSQLTFSSIITTVSSGAPEFFLGTLQNLTAAGLYSRSNGLVQIFYRLVVDAVDTVCLPWFANKSREQGNLVDPFLISTAYVTALGWSFCFIIIFLAHPIIRVLYGDQWDQSVDLARLLAIAMAFNVPVALCKIALLSSGLANIIVKATLFSAIQSVIFVTIGASQGLLTFGITVILASALNAAIWVQTMSSHIQVPLSELLFALRKSMLVAIISAIVPIFAFWLYGPYPEEIVEPLLLGIIGSIVCFIIGVLVFNHPLQEELFAIWEKITKILGV